MKQPKDYHLVIPDDLRQALERAAVQEVQKTHKLITWQEYARKILWSKTRK